MYAPSIRSDSWSSERRRPWRRALVAGLLTASLATPVHAIDEPIPGKLFLVKRSSSGTMITLLGKPAKTGPLFALPATDPGVAASTFEVVDTAGDGGDDVYDLNGGQWKGLGTPAGSKGWKYTGAGTAADPCKLVLVKPKLIKAVCKDGVAGGGITVSPPFAGDAGAVLAIGSDRYCADFGGTAVKNDATQVKRKDAPAPGACPVGPTPIDTPTATVTPTPTETATTTPGGADPTATPTPTVTPTPPYNRTFAAGSLIIPMDTAYQDTGMLKAFGLVHALLRSGIPVSWTIKPGKASSEADFTASAVDISTAAVINAHGYRGGPWVVDASDAAAALPLIAAWQTSNVTAVHQATAAFSADVTRQLTAAPRTAVFADGNQPIIFGYLNAAGIPDVTGVAWSSTSVDLLTPPAVAGATTSDHGDGALFDANGQPRYCNLASAHWNVTSAQALPEVVAEVRQFLQHPVHFFAECQSVDAFENLVPYGHFLTPNGFTVKTTPLTVDLFHADSPFVQIDGAFGTTGGSEPAYALPTGDAYKASGVTMITAHGATEGAWDVWLSGYLDGSCPPDAASCSVGRISYLGGHQYTVTVPISANPKTQGTRLFLQSLFAGCP
jgi:hypothetical protein